MERSDIVFVDFFCKKHLEEVIFDALTVHQFVLEISICILEENLEDFGVVVSSLLNTGLLLPASM